MKRRKRGNIYISCLSTNFKQPIADFVDHLLKTQLPEYPDDPPRSTEVDYATSLIVLLMLEFEGAISRARHFDRRIPAKKIDKVYVLPWMRSLNNPKLKPIIDRLSEIYFLRDAIVHNHIWTFRQTWTQGRAHYSDFNLDLTWQSETQKINRVIAGTLPLKFIPRTRKLNMIVVPTFIGRKEVAVVFKTVKDALKVLHDLDYIDHSPRLLYVRYRGQLSFPFWRLIGKIQGSSLSNVPGLQPLHSRN